MQTTQTANRIHPLVAGAAASVMLVSLVGVAAITGLLPTSRGEAAPAAAAAAAAPAAAAAASTAAAPKVEREVVREVVREDAAPAARRVAQKPAVHHSAPAYAQQAAAPRYVQTGHDNPAPSYQQPAYQQPAYQQPARQVSPVGMAAGAVLGGVLGNQVGGGNGRTLATVAGAVGGGYLGNEVGKRYGY
jgi:uncharacterized protein YcfJ